MYTREPDRRIRNNELKRAFKSGNLNLTLINHSLNFDHLTDFQNIKTLAFSISNYYGRIF